MIGAIDCGTNTIRLLITGPDGARVRTSRVVRLGEGVDRTGRLSEAALARTFAAVDEIAEHLREHGVPPDRLRFCATSATRDAVNGHALADGVRERLGVEVEVLSGEEEARLTYAGAVASLPATAPRPVLVVDLGGGSTEVVLDGRGTSLDIGSVRLHERHLRSDPPTSGEIAAAHTDVDAALDSLPVDLASAATVVGVSGTALTVAAAVLGDLAAVDGVPVRVADLRAAADRIVATSVAARAAQPWVLPGREDVIGAGALIWSRLLGRVTVATVTASVADLLDGIAAELNVPGRRRVEQE